MVVGAAGFEPAASCSQSRRSARLIYAPTSRNPTVSAGRSNIRGAPRRREDDAGRGSSGCSMPGGGRGDPPPRGITGADPAGMTTRRQFRGDVQRRWKDAQTGSHDLGVVDQCDPVPAQLREAPQRRAMLRQAPTGPEDELRRRCHAFDRACRDARWADPGHSRRAGAAHGERQYRHVSHGGLSDGGTGQRSRISDGRT